MKEVVDISYESKDIQHEGMGTSASAIRNNVPDAESKERHSQVSQHLAAQEIYLHLINILAVVLIPYSELLYILAFSTVIKFLMFAFMNCIKKKSLLTTECF